MRIGKTEIALRLLLTKLKSVAGWVRAYGVEAPELVGAVGEADGVVVGDEDAVRAVGFGRRRARSVVAEERGNGALSVSAAIRSGGARRRRPACAADAQGGRGRRGALAARRNARRREGGKLAARGRAVNGGEGGRHRGRRDGGVGGKEGGRESVPELWSDF
ncbi:hypothetical protein PR202_ga10922 [Eleusine coracana subsp. coracana]|uniref:Uncharacterized protein n=1 Tax=Eleusine coracana subsp. coracana TaxID=191504 RepID=A0AAV5C852_ELECO|nr:hypothetical protein PR202_ga10922 [Eleusine coracana subsp. coracana]